MSLGTGSYAACEVPNWLEVGKYSSIAAYVTFIEGSQHHLCHYNKKCVFTTNWDQPMSNLPQIRIGNDVWIGTGAMILPGIQICDGAIIGAGAVVAKDVSPYAVVVGNPARVKRYRFTKDQIEKLQEIRWWDWDDTKINEAKETMKDINHFLETYGA